MNRDRIRFRKIKYTGDQLRFSLVWEKSNGDAWDEYSMSSLDEPHPDFVEALQGLIPSVIEICELHPEDMEAEFYRHSIRGVTFGYAGEDEILGASITSMRGLNDSNSPLVLNTPYLPEEDLNDMDGPVLPQKCIRALEVLMDEAEAYLNRSKRSQPELFAVEAAK